MSDYRDAPARCPACSATMEERAAGDAIVDVCPGCRGLWIDWFDGDTLHVAADAAPLSLRPTVPIDATRAACPRCHAALAFQAPTAVAGAGADGEAVGAVLLRCGECAGTFVPRSAFDELVSLRFAAMDPAESRSALARLVDAIRSLFAPAPREPADE